MKYTWESVGNQDECVRKLCYCGPYLLEHVEEFWQDEVMMMASRVWLWNDQEKLPEMVAELPLIEYKRDTSFKCLEDWYAMNVLSEELFMGVRDEADED